MPGKRSEKAVVETTHRVLRNRMKTLFYDCPSIDACLVYFFTLMAPLLEKCFRCHMFVRCVKYDGNLSMLFPIGK